MPYNVLFVENNPVEDVNVERLLKRYGTFDVRIIPSDKPIPKEDYAKADSVVVHMTLSRAKEVAELHRDHPEVGLLVVPVTCVSNIHREFYMDDDKTLYFTDGFAEDDLVGAVNVSIEVGRSYIQNNSCEPTF